MMNETNAENIKSLLQSGSVIAYPTEAVWGLGCDPYNEQAVQDILRLKNRPIEKGLILVAASLDQVQPLLKQLPEDEIEILKQYWPGPHTFIIPDPSNLIPKWVKGEHESVAVRVSAHPVVQDVCNHFGSFVVSTSANPAGLEPARSMDEVKIYFNGEVITIVSGNIGKNSQPTQIRDLRTGRILRP